MELPLLGVAVMVSLEEDMLTCTKARIGLGVLAPTPMRAKNAEEILKGQKLNDQTLKKAGEAAAAECKARDTVRCAAWYRRDMVKVLVPRMAKVATQRAGE
jgi:carbon-monoxide dehydrogenase medium subunit